VGYLINGVEVEADDEGFLLEPDFSEEAARAIAQTEGIELTDEHWLVIRYLHERFQEDGQTPNFRNMVKDFDQEHPGTDWQGGRADQAVRQGRLLICVEASRSGAAAARYPLRGWTPAGRSRLMYGWISGARAPGRVPTAALPRESMNVWRA
jgi:TusE/DsrC/DsvC family sulfur relay protein